MEQGLKRFENTPGAVLLDVRSADEYSQGRLSKSMNFPIQKLPTIGTVIPDKDTPVFVYCLSGARSARAAAFLQKMGYTNVTNLGGINGYKGVLEK